MRIYLRSDFVKDIFPKKVNKKQSYLRLKYVFYCFISKKVLF